MKKTIFLLMISIQVWCQDKNMNDVQASLQVLRQQLLVPDTATLAKILHKKLTYGHSGGKIETKDELMPLLLNANYHFLELNFDQIDIKIAGNTAIIRHMLTGRSHDKDKPEAQVNIKVLLVMIKEKNRWQLLARQAVKTPI